jgi:hypothetical protein
MSKELIEAIARVRRAMPRNMDVMVVCDGAERAAVSRDTPAAAPPSRDNIIVSEHTSRDTAECAVCARKRDLDAGRQRKRRGAKVKAYELIH